MSLLCLFDEEEEKTTVKHGQSWTQIKRRDLTWYDRFFDPTEALGDSHETSEQVQNSRKGHESLRPNESLGDSSRLSLSFGSGLRRFYFAYNT